MDDKSLEVEQYKREMLAAILQLQADNAALKVEIKHLKGRSTFMIDSICDALDECSETVRLWNNQNLIKSPNPLLDAYGSGNPLPESGSESKHAETLAEKLVALEAENARLREAIVTALKVIGIISIPYGVLQAAMDETTPTTGILELAAEAVKWANIEPNDVGGLEKAETSLSKAHEALSPEVKAMLEGLSGD